MNNIKQILKTGEVEQVKKEKKISADTRKETRISADNIGRPIYRSILKYGNGKLPCKNKWAPLHHMALIHWSHFEVTRENSSYLCALVSGTQGNVKASRCMLLYDLSFCSRLHKHFGEQRQWGAGLLQHCGVLQPGHLCLRKPSTNNLVQGADMCEDWPRVQP